MEKWKIENTYLTTCPNSKTTVVDIKSVIMSHALRIRIHVIELVNNSYTVCTLLSEDNDVALNELSPLFMYKSFLHYDAIVLKSITLHCMNVNPPSPTVSDTFLPADALTANADMASVDKTVPDIPMIYCHNANNAQAEHACNKGVGANTKKNKSSVHMNFIQKVHKHKGLKIAHLNIRSFYNKFDEVKHILCKSQLDTPPAENLASLHGIYKLYFVSLWLRNRKQYSIS